MLERVSGQGYGQRVTMTPGEMLFRRDVMLTEWEMADLRREELRRRGLSPSVLSDLAAMSTEDCYLLAGELLRQSDETLRRLNALAE